MKIVIECYFLGAALYRNHETNEGKLKVGGANPESKRKSGKMKVNQLPSSPTKHESSPHFYLSNLRAFFDHMCDTVGVGFPKLFHSASSS